VTQPDAGPQPPDRTARRWLWVAIGVVIAWFLIAGAVGPVSGQLSTVQKNDNAAFLPASAESTKVINEQAGFSNAKSFPEFVLFTNESGLTAQNRAAIASFAEALPAVPVAAGKTVADFLVPGVPLVPVPSKDGKAELISLPLDSQKVAGTIDGKSPILLVTQAVRTSAAAVPGVTSYVTGPGGILADLIEVFGAIDTTLLGVTALVVALILILVYRSPFLWLIPLLCAGTALSLASAFVYVLAKNDVLTLNGQSQGILTVLVFGAGTDYALLLVSRYREELHHHRSHFAAMAAAWRGVVEPIVASGATRPR